MFFVFVFGCVFLCLFEKFVSVYVCPSSDVFECFLLYVCVCLCEFLCMCV